MEHMYLQLLMVILSYSSEFLKTRAATHALETEHATDAVKMLMGASSTTAATGATPKTMGPHF